MKTRLLICLCTSSLLTLLAYGLTDLAHWMRSLSWLQLCCLLELFALIFLMIIITLTMLTEKQDELEKEIKKKKLNQEINAYFKNK